MQYLEALAAMNEADVKSGVEFAIANGYFEGDTDFAKIASDARKVYNEKLEAKTKKEAAAKRKLEPDSKSAGTEITVTSFECKR